jgi:hypothetical protein
MIIIIIDIKLMSREKTVRITQVDGPAPVDMLYQQLERRKRRAKIKP